MAKGMNTIPAGSLLLRTIQLLKERECSLPEVQAGTGLPWYWLRKFGTGEIKDPSVNRVQKLFEFLNGKPLDLSSNS